MCNRIYFATHNYGKVTLYPFKLYSEHPADTLIALLKICFSYITVYVCQIMFWFCDTTIWRNDKLIRVAAYLHIKPHNIIYWVCQKAVEKLYVCVMELGKYA